jgi:membrane protein
VQNLFAQVLALVGSVVPTDSMQAVQTVLANIVEPNKGTLLSFGIFGIVWTASGGFAAAIEALNISYEVEEGRPFWVTRPLAVGLTFLVGILLLVALGTMILGPEFGKQLSQHRDLSWLFITAWPYIHWIVSFGFTVLAVEFLYFIAPNVRQRFWSTLPGAILSVTSWVGLSYAMGIYFRSFAHFNKTYGTVGAIIALMVWLYWNGFVMLIGAQLNCQLSKESKKGKIPQDEDKSGLTHLDLVA